MLNQFQKIEFVLSATNTSYTLNFDNAAMTTKIELCIDGNSTFDGAKIVMKRNPGIDGFLPVTINKSLTDSQIEITKAEGSISISEYIRTGTLIFELINHTVNTNVHCVLLFC